MAAVAITAVTRYELQVDIQTRVESLTYTKPLRAFGALDKRMDLNTSGSGGMSLPSTGQILPIFIR